MNAHADKTSENKTPAHSKAVTQKQGETEPVSHLQDHRPRTLQLQHLQHLAHTNPRTQQTLQLQARIQQHTLDTVQRVETLETEEENPAQGKFEPLQRVASGDDEEPGKPIQKTTIPKEDKKPLQGKFETIQKQADPPASNNTGLPDTSASSVQATQRKSANKNNTGLPDTLKSGIENLSGYSLDDVQVHYNSPAPAQLQAHAYAQGTDIHVAPGQEKHLPHEAWHVVQQKQGRVHPTKQLKGKVNINDDSGLEKEADVMGAKALTTGGAITQAKSAPYVPKQLAGGTVVSQTAQLVPFIGPQFNVAGNQNINYPGHGFVTGGTKPNTGCGTVNSITTASEKLAPGAASKPGTPTGMNTYRGGFSRKGGLVKDKNTNQASTKMHLINHRLENSGNTQKVASNIFLGTQMSNNPTHLNQVETPVINSLAHSSKKNANYETAMGNAQQIQDVGGNNVLYWPNAQLPAANAVNPAHLTDVFINGAGKAQLNFQIVAGKKKKLAAITGKALRFGVGMAGYAGIRHLWLTYRVTANYTGVPPHIMPGGASNVGIETVSANTKKGKQKASLLTKIANFTANFAPNAFPATFTNNVDYYYASYDPANKYAKESETHNINADL